MLTIEAANALANLTKTNLPDAIAEGDATQQPESEPFEKKVNAGDGKSDIVAEADAKENDDSNPFDKKSNVS